MVELSGNGMLAVEQSEELESWKEIMCGRGYLLIRMPLERRKFFRPVYISQTETN